MLMQDLKKSIVKHFLEQHFTNERSKKYHEGAHKSLLINLRILCSLWSCLATGVFFSFLENGKQNRDLYSTSILFQIRKWKLENIVFQLKKRFGKHFLYKNIYNFTPLSLSMNFHLIYLSTPTFTFLSIQPSIYQPFTITTTITTSKSSRISLTTTCLLILTILSPTYPPTTTAPFITIIVILPTAIYLPNPHPPTPPRPTYRAYLCKQHLTTSHQTPPFLTSPFILFPHLHRIYRTHAPIHELKHHHKLYT